MRIEFIHSERKGLAWSGGTLHVGSAEHHAVCLQGPGIAVDHAVLHADAHGIWLQVQPGAGRVYVNARPVREYALLRLGDTLSVGGQRMLLRAAEAAAADRADAPGEDVDTASPAASIRAVAGPLSGRSWSVHEGLTLGRAVHRMSEANTSKDACPSVRWRRRELWLDLADGVHESISINGVPVTESAPLHNADCIGLGGQRFVIDAWSLAPDVDSAEEEADRAVDDEPPEDSAGPRGEVWWLLLTAAALGLLIALFLLFHF